MRQSITRIFSREIYSRFVNGSVIKINSRTLCATRLRFSILFCIVRDHDVGAHTIHIFDREIYSHDLLCIS